MLIMEILEANDRDGRPREHALTLPMPGAAVTLQAEDALLLVDVQNDFLSWGALPARGAEHVVAAANAWIERFEAHALPIFFSRDWHPPDHCSFHEQGGPWPAHCIADSPGAAFPAELRLPLDARIVGKGKLREREAHSAFDGTPLKVLLQLCGVKRLFVGGMTTEFAVLHTVNDALALGYSVYVLGDAQAALDMHHDDGGFALKKMTSYGANLIGLSDLSG